MKKLFITTLVSLFSFGNFSQTIPANRTVDWSLAGLTNGMQEHTTVVNITDFGGIADGITTNNTAFSNALNALNNNPGVIFFGNGVYLFDQALTLPDNVIIRGNSADSTTLRFAASGDLIRITGSIESQQINVLQDASKNQTYLVLETNHNLSSGDYLKLTLDDVGYITSSWANRTVGQIIEISHVVNDTVFLRSPLRMDYPITLSPWVRKINPRKNVGIECLKVLRGTNDAFQSDNIHFEYAVESWVKGVESDSCNFAHIGISNSSNIEVRNSFFHDAYSYGNGGKGYGIMIHMTSNECLIENNVFKKLRHAMILQAGANANVFGYNYSIEPYWTEVSLPATSSGDMVLHGNYAYANLFEGNIGQNIVIDDSHGKNGPFNTFFRNRADLYGIFMNNNPASDMQNIVGNEVTNTSFTLGLYLIFGTDHLLHGNNIKGTINPSGTQVLSDTSYYLSEQPLFLSGTLQFPLIGTPNTYKSGENKAKMNYDDDIFTYCQADTEVTDPTAGLTKNEIVQTYIYPNPSSGVIHVETPTENNHLIVYSVLGKEMFSTKFTGNTTSVDIRQLPAGVYLISINSSKYHRLVKK